MTDQQSPLVSAPGSTSGTPQGCATAAGTSALTVSITSNRGYSTVLTAPADATAGPPTYAGFEEFERNTTAVQQALDGSYLAPTHTLTYTLPLYGGPVTFDATISVKTLVLDHALAAASAVFGLVTAGYSDCILDQVARSGPAPLSDAPGLVVECFPGLAQASALYRFYEKYIQPLSDVPRAALAAYDQAHDTSAQAKEVEGERADEGTGHPLGPDRGDLCAAVHAGAGPRAHRVSRASRRCAVSQAKVRSTGPRDRHR